MLYNTGMNETTKDLAPEGTPTPALIVAAAQALAMVCDGAVKEDGRGYNGIDSPIMKKLAAQASHSPRQLRLMWHILRKYTKQLEGRGILYAQLVPPPLPPRDEKSGQFKAAGRALPGEEAQAPASRRLELKWIDTKYGRRIAVAFGYDGQLVEVVKSLKKGNPKLPPWFDGETKSWLFPDTIESFDAALEVLEAVEPALDIKVEAELGRAIGKVREERRRAYTMSRSESADLAVPTKLPPLPFQRAGIQWTDERGGRALIADEMGLGKTVQALGYLALRPEMTPALVVCPATIRVNWARETQKFTSYKPLVISSKSSLKSLQKLGVDTELAPKAGYDVTIINYDLLETQTPQTWIKEICRGDMSHVDWLVEAAHYAVPFLNKAIRKAHPSIQPKLKNVLLKISALGGAANKKKFVKVFVNDIPLDEFLKAGGFKTMIVDEMHYLKDIKTQRTLACVEIQKKVKGVIGLTGTPIRNRPLEAWSQTQVIMPSLFPNFMDYARRFCAAQQTRFGWDFTGSSNLDELDRILRENLMIRREKKQVLKELPKATRVTIPLIINGHQKDYEKEIAPIIDEMASAKAARREWKARMAALSDEDRTKYLAEHAQEAAAAAGLTGYVLEQIEKAKQAATRAKYGECLKFIQDAQEQNGKVLVFATHQAVIEQLAGDLRKAGLKADHIHGGVSMAARVGIKDSFQDGDLEVLVCGIRAASEGLTLTASHVVIFIEFDWNPGQHDQAEARVDRIGQTVPPTMYYLAAMGTIDEQIVELIDAKREVVNSSVGEGHRTIDEDGIMDAILERMTGGRK